MLPVMVVGAAVNSRSDNDRMFPAFPDNRVLSEGELPCRRCGSGKADHFTRSHAYCPYDACATCDACAVCRDFHVNFVGACTEALCPYRWYHRIRDWWRRTWI